MRFLSLGKVDKNIIPIIVGCVFCILSRLVFLFPGDSKLLDHAIISNILVSISYFFTIIPFLILKYRTNNKHKIESIKNNDLEDMEDKDMEDKPTITQKDITKGKWLYIFLYNFIDFVQGIIIMYVIGLKSNYWILNIFITSIFYYLIFKIKLYKHHYLSMILIIVIGIILDLVLENLQYDINELKFVLLRLLREILYSSTIVLIKYLFEKKFCSIYEISLSNGIMNAILFIILAIFDYYFFKLDNFIEYFDKFGNQEILVIIGLMITQLGLYICTLIINKTNSPCHVFIIFVFGQLAYYVDFSKISKIFIIVCLLLILFMLLIFNEIIEINCFGLEKNTKKNIMKRARTESDDLLINNIKLIKDEEEKDFEENEHDAIELDEEKKLEE